MIGAAGVQRVVEILRDELSLAMALAGCRSTGDITPDWCLAHHVDARLILPLRRGRCHGNVEHYLARFGPS